MREFWLALSFLTIFPISIRDVASEKQMAKTLFYYPIVGLIIGAGLVLVDYFARGLSLGYAGDVLVIATWIASTGALHLDGLMDTADGIFSGRPREQKLDIMKDSRVGAMGAVVLLILIMLKISFLHEIPQELRYWVLLVAPALGRTAMVYAITFYPYARTGPGLGKCFGQKVSRLAFPVTFLFVLIAAYAMEGIGGLCTVVITGLLVALAARLIAKSLGGHTGDTYGALCEISETLMIMTVVVSSKWSLPIL